MPFSLIGFNDEMATLAERVRETTVQIRGVRGSLGAGIIWHTDGLIVTNAHVIRGETIEIILANGDAYTAQTIAEDRQADLAVLAIPAHNLPTVTVGNSQAIRPGEWVMALGHPFGIIDSATAGTVIGYGSNLPEMGVGRDWIALNLRLRPGHSGGPLVTAEGRMIGINTMITGPEVGYAIPVHVARAFLAEYVPASQPALV